MLQEVSKPRRSWQLTVNRWHIHASSKSQMMMLHMLHYQNYSVCGRKHQEDYSVCGDVFARHVFRVPEPLVLFELNFEWGKKKNLPNF